MSSVCGSSVFGPKSYLQPGVTEGLVDAVSLPHLNLQQVVNQVNRYREREKEKDKKKGGSHE